MLDFEQIRWVGDRDEVHIWGTTLDQPTAQFEQLARFLSPAEQARAARFSVARYRHRFCSGRGLLRILLGRYLQIEPAQLVFCYGPQGKPALRRDYGLRFNISHSGSQALYAVSWNREIGVDLERVRGLEDIGPIARRYFSPGEVKTLESLPSVQQLEGFFNCWTRKEAYLKADGSGLSQPLDGFDVSLRPGDPARLLRVARDPQESGRWSMQHLTPQPGYVAAVVVQGQGWQLRSGQLNFS